MADLENFGGRGFLAQNLKNSDVFTKIESDFSAEIGNSNVFFAQNQVVSKKKKKKRFSPKLRLIFRPESLGWGWWGGCIPKWSRIVRIEADFSAKIVTFRLVGGMHPPHPPLNPPLQLTGIAVSSLTKSENLVTATDNCRPVLPALVYSRHFVMSQSCKMQGCQWYGVKLIKL